MLRILYQFRSSENEIKLNSKSFNSSCRNWHSNRNAVKTTATMSPVAAGICILLLIDVKISPRTLLVQFCSWVSRVSAHVYKRQWSRHNYDCATPPVYSDFDLFNMAMMAPVSKLRNAARLQIERDSILHVLLTKTFTLSIQLGMKVLPVKWFVATVLLSPLEVTAR